MFIGQFFRAQQNGTIKSHNGGYLAYAQVWNAYNYCFSKIQLILKECLLDSV